jgi:hypothetical protein
MLELKPTRKHRNKSISLDSRIGTDGRTFCAACVDNVQENNLCPSCGGGFALRSIRLAEH